ncbi:MAG: hypothetical protein HC872_08630 [Gammaproteobacteria bacterium]|nr:hypothetical protein [Gammaproteobacteria bacterium]
MKLFILGNGGVGKTQICRRLRGEAFDPSVPSTHGIQQFQVRLFDGDEEMPAVDAHVWDFGGQDVYLGTHALFVDRHAIFVLCWNPEYENTREFTQHGTLMRKSAAGVLAGLHRVTGRAGHAGGCGADAVRSSAGCTACAGDGHA